MQGQEIEFERNRRALMVRGLLTALIVVFGISLLTLWEYSEPAASHAEAVWLTAALNLALLLFGAYQFSIPLADYRAIFTEEGVTRPGLLGSQSIRWSDVIRCRLQRRGAAWVFSLQTPTQVLRLSAFVYSRPDLVWQEIARRVPGGALE